MTDFESLTPQSLRERGSMKWNRRGPEVLPMWVAEMDYPLAEPIEQAIAQVVARQGFGYAEVDDRVPRAFADFASRRLGMTVNPEWTTVVPHVLAGIEVALDVFTPPEAGIVVTTPAYMHFLEIPGLIGRQAVEVPLLETPDADGIDERWALDLAGVERAFAAGARSVILCQPYNPVGKVFSAEELAGLAEIVARYDGWVVSDEIHAPLTMPGIAHQAYAEVNQTAASHCITVTSASKSFSIPGLPCATVTLHTAQAARRFATDAHPDRLYGATTLGIEANLAAFTEGGEWLDGARATIARNGQRVKDFLAAELPEVGFQPPNATYLGWLDLRGAGLGTDPAGWILEHGNLWLNSGGDFGAPGQGFARMNLATTGAILEEGLGRLKGALDRR
ncbi:MULTISPECIES: MalY/PatB family protein [unclassified Luteococcus]|uniref:MalY/PatB family protein n=1 Tax=unclassified Luteococcus TaxID=2639923 RepID=UPI00313EE9A4